MAHATHGIHCAWHTRVSFGAILTLYWAAYTGEVSVACVFVWHRLGIQLGVLLYRYHGASLCTPGSIFVVIVHSTLIYREDCAPVFRRASFSTSFRYKTRRTSHYNTVQFPNIVQYSSKLWLTRYMCLGTVVYQAVDLFSRACSGSTSRPQRQTMFVCMTKQPKHHHGSLARIFTSNH